MYLPGWDPSQEDYANTTIDLSHAAIARSDVVEMAERMGDRLRHIHLTDGTGSAKDEHLVPGRGVMQAEALPAPPGRHRLRRPRRAGDQHPSLLDPQAERENDLRESLEFARAAPGRPHAMTLSRGRRPGAPDTRAEVLDAARVLFAERGFSGYDDPRGRRRCRGRPVAGAPLLRLEGRPLHGRAGDCPIDPRELLATVVAAGPDGAGERLVRTLLVGLGRPAGAARAAGRGPLGDRRRRRDAWSPRGSSRSSSVRCCAALVVDRPEVRVPLVASQVVG